MTLYEVSITNCNGPEWHWQVIRIATVSDTESVVASGECTSAAKASRAAVLERDRIIHGGAAVDDGVFDCVRCRRNKESS